MKKKQHDPSETEMRNNITFIERAYLSVIKIILITIMTLVAFKIAFFVYLFYQGVYENYYEHKKVNTLLKD
jgi:uncharacterized membrane protein